MALIKHNKIKNTGIIFEVLTRQLTSDTLSGKESKALDILKRNFVNTELGKEYKLYETIFNKKNLNESKANIVLETVLNASKNINKSKLKSEKYNLIKELKELYNLDSLFRIKLENYKKYAAFSNLLEISNSDNKDFDINQIIENKSTIIESLTNSPMSEDLKENLMEEFKSCDKDTRIIANKIMMDRFNEKYDILSTNQKRILREYISSIDSTSQLRDFYNKEIGLIQKSLLKEIKSTKSEVTKIKLEEISKFMIPLDKKSQIKMDNLVELLQYHSLIEELSIANA